jgi:hypothetical protein
MLVERDREGQRSKKHKTKMVEKRTNAHIHPLTHAPIHTHTHTHTRVRTNPHTHTHTHAHTNPHPHTHTHTHNAQDHHDLI